MPYRLTFASLSQVSDMPIMLKLCCISSKIWIQRDLVVNFEYYDALQKIHSCHPCLKQFTKRLTKIIITFHNIWYISIIKIMKIGSLAYFDCVYFILFNSIGFKIIFPKSIRSQHPYAREYWSLELKKRLCNSISSTDFNRKCYPGMQNKSNISYRNALHE